MRALLRAILPLFGQVSVNGPGSLGEGGQLLVCNHVGWADPIWLAYAVHPRLIHQMAKKELFRRAWIGGLLKSLGAFPVDRARPSIPTLKYAADLLKMGELVLIFPTGTRDHAGREARRGAAVIAGMAGVQIIPVRYSGPATIRLEHLLRRPRIVVTLGRPVQVPDNSAGRRKSMDLTASLDEAIKALGI